MNTTQKENENIFDFKLFLTNSVYVILFVFYLKMASFRDFSKVSFVRPLKMLFFFILAMTISKSRLTS